MTFPTSNPASSRATSGRAPKRSRVGHRASLSCLLLAGAMTASAGEAMAQVGSAAARADHTAADRLIRDFAQASDRSDAAALEALLHPSFRVIFNIGTAGTPTKLERNQYLQMVREGKVGGASRHVVVTQIAAVGGFGTAVAEMVRPDAIFNGVYSFIEQDGRWLLLQEAVRMSPAGK
jgi:Putative lumazine-binding